MTTSLRTRMNRLGTAALAIVAASVGVVAVGAQPASASTVGGSITRSEVISRAIYWLNRGDTWYSQNQSAAISDGDGHSYRPDCSGFVAMAWHLPKKSDGWDLNTGDFGTYGAASSVALNDLKAGDAILTSGHIELFDKWINASNHAAGLWTYGEHDFGRKTEHDTMSWSYLTSNFRGLHYNGIVDDGGTPPSAPPPTGAPKTKFTDYNADGKTDLAALSAGALHTWLGSGNGGFTYQGNAGGGWDGYTEVTPVGDINSDGRGDIVAIGSDGGINRWYATGGGSYTYAGVYGLGWGAYHNLTGVGDINQDGIPDLVAVDSSGILHRWFGTGGGGFTYIGTWGGGWDAYSSLTGVGDINQDGIGDLVAVDSTGVLHRWFGTGGGGFTYIGTWGGGWGGYQITSVGDMNGDGIGDLVGQANGALHRWYGTTGGGFADGGNYGNGWTPYTLL